MHERRRSTRSRRPFTAATGTLASPDHDQSARKLIIALLVLVSAGVLANVIVTLRPHPVYLSQPVELTKDDAPAWEYKIASVADLEWDTTMAVLGDEGWELIFACRTSGGDDKMLYEAIFKRQKRG